MDVREINIQPILDKALAGDRLDADDCTALLESYDIARIGAAADEIRKARHPDNIVTYIIDRNVNYTNVCNVVCTFCAFYRRPGAPDTYVRTIDEICDKIDETIALGGTGVLMQGGLHPDFGVEWYEDLLRTCSACAICRTRPAALPHSFPGPFNARTPPWAGGSRTSPPELTI